MIVLSQEYLLITVIVFCRVGACFMVLPGISSGRVPPQVRLFLSLSVALAITPLAAEDLHSVVKTTQGNPVALIVTELITGLMLGMLIRSFFVALEFSAIAVANFIGFGGIVGMSIDDDGMTSPIATALTLPAAALFFILDQHIQVVMLLQNSYVSLPVEHSFDLEPSLRTIGTTLGAAFNIALQVSAPLLIYSLMINFVFGLLNKMVPQVPAYFISVPFVIVGGLAILYLLIGPMLLEFSAIVGQAISAIEKNG
jgi:flagellar biosynthesis protein FliR